MDIAFWIEPGMMQGEGAFIRHLVMGLRAEGQGITFIHPHGYSAADLPVLGSRILTYRWNRWERLPVLQKLRLNSLAQALNDAPPDLLVIWGSSDCSGGGALPVLSAMVPSLPIVLWCWDASELFTPLVKLPAVRHLVASSQSIAARVGRPPPLAGPSTRGIGLAREGPGAETGESLPPVTVVHPGVYTEETIACFDVEGQMPCLVSLDPLSSRAAYESLLKACRRLVDRGREFLLFAYEKGSAEHPIWRMAEDLGLLESMSFVPFQQDAEPLLLNGDLYIHVLPTARVQYRCLEAMGRGLAVVTCPNHSADYLIDGQTCRLVGPQTPDAWCAALEELLSDRTKAVALARGGQQFVREHHGMGRTIEQFGSICRQVAGVSIPLRGDGH